MLSVVPSEMDGFVSCRVRRAGCGWVLCCACVEVFPVLLGFICCLFIAVEIGVEGLEESSFWGTFYESCRFVYTYTLNFQGN